MLAMSSSEMAGGAEEIWRCSRESSGLGSGGGAGGGGTVTVIGGRQMI